jgi:hypothetical protein
MDGPVVNETLRVAVTTWAADSVGRFRTTDRPAYESVHLDELLGGGYSRDHAVEYALDSVAVLREHASEAMVSFRVAVVLEVSPELAPTPPAPESLQSEVSPHEPPSLYVCRDILAMYAPHFEEFRIPLDAPTGATVCYYTCFRSLEAARLGHEYSRVVWYDLMNEDSARPYDAMIGS